VRRRMSTSLEWPERVDSISVSFSIFCYSEDRFSSDFKPIVKALALVRESTVICLALRYCSKSQAAFKSSSSSASARFSFYENREWNFENSLLLSLARRRRLALLTKVRQTTRTAAVTRMIITNLRFFPSSKKFPTRARNRILARGRHRSTAPAFVRIQTKVPCIRL